MQNELPAFTLRRIWSGPFRINWIFGTFLIFLFGIPRFIIVLQANVTGKFNWVSLIFIAMWLTPFIFLTRSGRKEIGLVRPKMSWWLPGSFAMGLLICAVVFGVGALLYGDSLSNWFVYLSLPFVKMMHDPTNKLPVFLFSALFAMLFSPIGEEILYRGLIHKSFVSRFGEQGASRLDSLAFALVHLAHFGIVYAQGQWQFLLVPSLLWLGFMFLTCRIFFICRKRTQSLLGAILCHAGFNLAMMYFIFYHIL